MAGYPQMIHKPNRINKMSEGIKVRVVIGYLLVLLAGFFIGWCDSILIAKDIMSFAFTIIGTVVGVSLVYCSYKATLASGKSAKQLEALRYKDAEAQRKSTERIAALRQGLAVNETRMGIYRRLVELRVKLGNNIENLQESIDEGKIEGMQNPRSSELWRLELPIMVHFSEETFSKYKELVHLIRECSRLNATKEVTNKYDEAHQAYEAMDCAFKELMDESIPLEMRLAITL